MRDARLAREARARSSGVMFMMTFPGGERRPSCTRLWGPVSEARTREIGALAAAASVLVKPNEVHEDLEAALRAIIPLHVLPTPFDRSTPPRPSEHGFQRAAFCTKPGFCGMATVDAATSA